MEARAQPLRRGADRDIAEDAADVPRAAVEVLDSDVYRLGVDHRRVVRRGRMQLAAEQCRHLARDADHREEVDAIHRRRDVEHLVADREHVDEGRARLEPVGQEHDPRVVVAEPDLVLGKDHPARGLAAQLPLVEGLVEDRQVRTGQRDGDRCAGLEVPRATHDLPRVALSHVDLAHPQPIGVPVGADLEDAAHEEAAHVPVDVGDADLDHAIHLERRDREALGDLVCRRIDRDVLPQPGQRHSHQNCPRSRGSFRQSSRRSGIPCRRTAIRSSPQPKAKPVYRSGS